MRCIFRCRKDTLSCRERKKTVFKKKILSKIIFFIQKDIILPFYFELMVTDLKYLQQMTGNDGNMIKEMIEMFLHQLSEARSDFDLLLDAKNWSELSRLAHKVKSSALVMGMELMAKDLKELEMLAKEGRNIEQYPEYIARLNEMIDKTEVELRTYIND